MLEASSHEKESSEYSSKSDQSAASCDNNNYNRFFSLNYYLNFYGLKLGKCIGEGSYSKVKLCTRKGHVEKFGVPNGSFACKVIDKKKASEDFVQKFLPRELDIVKKVEHPNLVKVYDIVEFDHQIYLFMEYCPNGDLLEFVKAQGSLSEVLSQHYFRQILSAVAYLHKLDICHRDLKCENILLTVDEQVRISDFGFARYCRDHTGKRVLSTTYCGSCAYGSPEVLKGIAYNPKFYDIWSLGCILFIILTGHMPYDESNIQKMLENQLNKILIYPHCVEDKISQTAKSLIRHLLEPDVTKRATIDQAIAHRWLRDGSSGASKRSRQTSGAGDAFIRPVHPYNGCTSLQETSSRAGATSRQGREVIKSERSNHGNRGQKYVDVLMDDRSYRLREKNTPSSPSSTRTKRPDAGHSIHRTYGIRRHRLNKT